VTERIAELVLAGASAGAIRAAATQQGLVPLAHAGMDLVAAGRTTIEEVYRVTRDVPEGSAAPPPPPPPPEGPLAPPPPPGAGSDADPAGRPGGGGDDDGSRL
jgi:hypothetical protein